MGVGRNRQTFCVVTRDVTEEKYNESSCSSGTHIHISWMELDELSDSNQLEPAAAGKPGYDGGRIERQKIGEGLEPDYLFEWLIPGKVIRFKRNSAVRGLSAKYGEYHANGIVAKKDWALAMLGQIQDAPRRRLQRIRINTKGG